VHASTGHEPASEWFLPTDAIIRIQLDGGAMTLRTLEGRLDLPCASIVGPTSRAFGTTSHRGVLVSVGIRPLGWTALTERQADAYRGRAVDLNDVTSGRFVTRLLDRLRIVSDESFLASALDEALKPLL